MLNHPTLTQLDVLGFAGMATAFKELSSNPDAKALDHAEWLGLLLDREVTVRKDKRLKSRLRAAKLRFGPSPQLGLRRGYRSLTRARHRQAPVS